MPNQLLRLVSLAIVLAPLALSAQTPAPATVTFDVNLTVPLDLKDLNPLTDRVDLLCGIQPTGSPAPTVALKAVNRPLSVVVNGAFKGNLTQQYTVTSDHALVPGQQWSYFCSIAFRVALAGGGGESDVTPGDKTALIASGSRSVSGTFTTP
jgi:hypothetical protein